MNPDSLPIQLTPLPPQWRWVRFAAVGVVALIFILSVVQFQSGTMKYHRRAIKAAQTGETVEKAHKGAIGRWRNEVAQFWAGQNIYLPPLAPGQIDDRPDNAAPVKHPNMPFVVLLLTPFSLLPVPAMALVYNVLKLAVIAAIVWMVVQVVVHDGSRIPDWAALLGVFAAADFIVGDIQHGNTNVFVAGAVVAHLFFYRRGRDGLAGAFLALGICLKVTPLLFVVYWLYQRQWKLVLSAAVVTPALILSPALFVGWSFFAETFSTWFREIVVSGAGGAWYPVHVNQSLPSVISRYFTGGDSGNILWDPDDSPVPISGDWITLIDLGPEAARWLIRALQVAIVGLSACAIGLRRLPRDDGRRGLHYGLIVSMMLLLNQRTWDHHATYLVVAHVALAYAIARGNLSRPFRKGLAIALAAAVAWMFVVGGDVLEVIAGSEEGANRLIAYGTAFWHFLAVWVLCLIVTRALRDSDAPYAPQTTAAQASPGAELAPVAS